jgi:hypothetical protein
MTRPDRALETEIIGRAQGRCEYCHFPESAAELPFHIDHIIAEKHGGNTTSANLAWACFSCNLRKGPNIAGIDPESGVLTRLYHPRIDQMDRTFRMARCDFWRLLAGGYWGQIFILDIHASLRIKNPHGATTENKLPRSFLSRDLPRQ